MKIKYVLTFLFLILLSSPFIAQEKDEYGNINIKKLTYEDMVRIYGDIYKPGKVYKVDGNPREIREVIMRGNKIITVVFNYGSICKPNYLSGIASLVWQGLGYGFEFGPLAAAEVETVLPDGTKQKVIIVDDSFVLTGQGSYSPDGTLKWGWLPKEGYADPNQKEIARLNAPDANKDGKPDSWPERWYSPGAGKYVWPAFLGDQSTAPDEEVYYVMDDYTNQSFLGQNPYYPFPSDSSKRGLGLDAEVRIIQFNNPLAEDIIFLVYQITNASEKSIPRAYFGMHGDPHVGGATDFSDDRAYFIPPTGLLADPFPQRARSMVYAWDDDMRGMGGRPAGYFGWKFLESPTNSFDGKDNDDDGITDENPFNSAGNYIDGVSIPLTFGISNVAKYTAVFGAPKPRYQGDEDGDWNVARDDVGIDGTGPDSPNYPGPDYGEADGFPSQAWYLDVNDNSKYDVGELISDIQLPGYKWAGSEPNFGLRDISESDQIGLRTFRAATYTNSLPNVPKNTSLMWEWLSSDTIDANQTLLTVAGDNIFNFGTGPLSLGRGETQRFSMAVLFGDNLNDLILNAETSTRVLEADYRFAQPPLKPVVKVVPGDKRVTLYWDTRAEKSVDPLTGKEDFQGYKIYRSQDYTFSDVYKITDGNGIPFLGQALFDPNTGKRAQFDKIDSLSGFHPVEYQGRAIRYYIGENTGLVHEYVDSTVKNGVTYYYAVVSFDGGSIEVGKQLAPSESQAVIQRDPISGKLGFDVNTAMVIPGGLPLGVNNASVGVNGIPQATVGNSTGSLQIKILDHLDVENRIFKVSFVDSLTYNVLDSTGVEESFISKDTVFVALGKGNLVSGSVIVKDESNTVIDPAKYFVNLESGRIRGLSTGSLPSNKKFNISYRYLAISKSKLLKFEDANPSFYGMKLYVKNDPLEINFVESKFLNTSINVIGTIFSPAIIGTPKVKYRADWEVRWNNLDTLANGQYEFPGDTVRNQSNQIVVTPFTIWNTSENVKAVYLVNESIIGTRNNRRWDWGEGIVLRPTVAIGSTTSYELRLTLDSNKVMVLPKNGDVYQVKTFKPFRKGDEYLFESKAVKFDAEKASAGLNNIYVVPNPYVAFSPAEVPGLTAEMRGDKNLQFRNLPSKCTIRIYTLTGELIQTLYKDDNTPTMHWDLLTYEGQRIAYGVYIYHVDAPGVGEKIGRFAVIK